MDSRKTGPASVSQASRQSALVRRHVRAIALTATAVLLVACGTDDDEGDPTGPGVTENSVTFTRADGSQISFPTGSLLFVWCGPWEEGSVPTESLHVVFSAPGGAGPAWDLRAVVADVTLGQPLQFPNVFMFDQPKDVDLFILDPPNELSTSDDRSSGFVTFQQLQCVPGGDVQFSIDAVVGSEFGDGPSVTATGTFRAPVGQPPAG